MTLTSGKPTYVERSEGCSKAGRRGAENQTTNVEYVAVESDTHGNGYLWQDDLAAADSADLMTLDALVVPHVSN